MVEHYHNIIYTTNIRYMNIMEVENTKTINCTNHIKYIGTINIEYAINNFTTT